MSEDSSNGTHLLLDLWGATNLKNKELIDATLHKAARACGATVLDIHLHEFGNGGGITGVIVLAESHITIHTWPEKSYAAIDVFMCGSMDVSKSVSSFKDAFKPKRIEMSTHSRGK